MARRVGYLRTFNDDKLYSASASRALKRLDKLLNWERTDRSSSNVRRYLNPSAEPAKTLLHRLGNPHNSFSAVHVTGSKGKGSVSFLVSAGLRESNFVNAPVGTYGSPHVETVNERIRIDGAPIDDQLLGETLTTVLDAREEHPVVEEATWFDVMSVSGMLAFRLRNVKWAVVEVGMGGRFDSTNVLSAPVSVITNIHLEHMAVIGPTLKHIAHEKAGIIAPGANVICGLPEQHELAPIFKSEALSHIPPAVVHFCPPEPHMSIFEQNLHLARKALGRVAVLEGHSEMKEEEILTMALAHSTAAALPARQERFVLRRKGGFDVHVLLDGAHVPESVRRVLEETRAEKKHVIVLGVGQDKDYESICRVVTNNAFHVFATAAGPEKMYLPASALGQVLVRMKMATSVVSNVEEALHKAIEMAYLQQRSVAVLGSLHVAGKLRKMLGELQKSGAEEEKRKR